MKNRLNKKNPNNNGIFLACDKFWIKNYKGPTIYLLVNGCYRLNLAFWQSLKCKNENELVENQTVLCTDL